MVVASKSAVCEDSGGAGMQVCCSWPPVGDCDHGRALCGCWGTRVMVVPTQVGQSHVSYLLCRLLKVIEERSHEGFTAEGARTPASGLTARAQGCSWHGACWLAKPSISGLPKPRGGVCGGNSVSLHSCGARPCSSRPVWGWQGSILFGAGTNHTDTPQQRFALLAAGW